MKPLRLCAAAGLLALVFLVVLPQWARQPAMRAALERHEAHGINGGATYYTDSPAALSGLQSLRELKQDQPELFWKLR
jgi:hypothetical protein